MPDIYDTYPTLYKLCFAAEIPGDAWTRRGDWASFYKGTQTTPYISLQEGESLKAMAAEAPFAGKEDVMLLTFRVETMVEEACVDVKIEDGEPRAYDRGGKPCGGIAFACLMKPPELLKLTDGKHVLPLFGEEAAAAAAALLEATAIDSDAHSSDDDGLDRFDQHTYDLDDDGNDALDPS
mmetsp:Transcript_7661/g.12889  ORF Transcript_7661/g.12889 Transcript_7661/m.12889 type:complete len:180 (-) Transcript_7661:115-654(-)